MHAAGLRSFSFLCPAKKVMEKRSNKNVLTLNKNKTETGARARASK